MSNAQHAFGSQRSAFSSQKNMRIMRMHEALWVNPEMNLFCGGLGFTKQILEGVFGVFCLILPHIPHVLRIVNTAQPKNMRLMREYEDRVFKGLRLSCIEMGMGSRPKYEAVMREYEDDPHVLAPFALRALPPNGRTQFGGRG